MATKEQILDALERQRKILNELARLCAQIGEELKGESHATL